MMSTTTDVSLSREEIARYSRQLILPEIGVDGQLKLKKSSVLIVGAGGLGCPVAIYLAAAGIGKIGVVDYDQVDRSNLHRQILHSENDIGFTKSDSVKQSIKQINSEVEVMSYALFLSSANALEIIHQSFSAKYDIVVDASDNVPTRYLLNDACVLAKKPLVSGSALRFEGQLTVYNHDGGPCYRCLFPVPPPPEAVTNCSDGGVLGPVPGLIGTMQALEVIKLAAALPTAYSNRMLLFDGLTGVFRTVRLRNRRKDCSVCGDHPDITSLLDYVVVCGMAATDSGEGLQVLHDDERISCQAYKSMVDAGTPHVLVDVREPVETGICSLPRAHNLPFSKMNDVKQLNNLRAVLQRNMTERATLKKDELFPVVVVCRRGNDSQLAVRSLRSQLGDLDSTISVCDIAGGLYAWSDQVDPDFPKY